MEKIQINPELMGAGYRFPDISTRKIAGSRIYLHGSLQHQNGYDGCGFVEPNIPIDDGVYPCEVLEINDDCTLFLWTSGEGVDMCRLGLIVANNDEEDIEFAKDKYIKKPYHL